MAIPLDPSRMELHNMTVRDKRMVNRRGLVATHTLAAFTGYVGGFTVENPQTSEAYHYLFEQATLNSIVTLRVFNEEFVELFNYLIGPMSTQPVFGYGVVNNQLMIGSPDLPAPLYGLVGGGLIPALKTVPPDFDLTVLDMPPGLLCAWKGRIVIAQGPNLLINTGDIDPRTFVAENIISLPGNIYDILEGPDGALYAFTSADVYVIPADVLSQQQIPVGFISTITGVSTGAPKQAATSNGVIGAIGRDGLLLISGGQVTRIDLAPYEGKRFFSRPIEVEDYRRIGQIWPTTDGFMVGLSGRRNVLIEINLRQGYRSAIWTSANTNLFLVGTLRARDAETLLLITTRVLQTAGTADFDASAIRGVACGRLSIPAEQSPVVRWITVAADNVGQQTHTYLGGADSALTTPTASGDVIIGTSSWGVLQTYTGREARTSRHALAVRSSDFQVELGCDGGLRTLDVGDIEVHGQGRKRRDLSP